MRIEKILSEFDGLGLEIAVIVPEGNPRPDGIPRHMAA
mgnify:CR=1 FL=1